MDQTNTTDLSLLEFLDIIGAALDSPEGWDNSEDTWMEYVDKTGVPTNHEYHFTDWVEVGPAVNYHRLKPVACGGHVTVSI